MIGKVIFSLFVDKFERKFNLSIPYWWCSCPIQSVYRLEMHWHTAWERER